MENQNGKTKVFIKYLCVATIAGVLFTVNIVLKFQPISRSNSCKCSTTVHLYEIKPCLLSLIQRYDTFNVLSADGTDGLRQGLIAAETAAHVSTVQQHAASWVTQAYHAHVLRYVHAVLLLLSSFSCTYQFKLPPHVLLLPPQLQLAIVPASRPHQHSHTCQRTNTRQHPPHRRLPFLLQPQGLKVVRAQEVLWTIGGWADLWEAVCVQDELAHCSQRRAHFQHLLRFKLTFGLLSAQVLTDQICEAVTGLVELLMDNFHFGTRGLQGTEHTHKCLVHTQQVKGHSIHTLVKHTLAVCPERCDNISASLLQSSVSHDPSEMILICCSAAQGTFLIVSNVENSCAV